MPAIIAPPLLQLVLFGVAVAGGSLVVCGLSKYWEAVDSSQPVTIEAFSPPLSWVFHYLGCFLLPTAFYDRFVAAGHVTLDGQTLAVQYAWALWRACRHGGTLYGWMCGMVLGGYERFALGYILHALPSAEYQKSHREFHVRLCKRKIDRSYHRWDDVHEIVGFLALFGVRWLVFWCWIPNALAGKWVCALWLGLSTEQFYGQLLRVYLQYVPLGHLRQQTDKASHCASWNCQIAYIWRRFLENAEAYYFYHLVVNEFKCSGFSAPFWDDVFGRNPLKRKGLLYWTWCWFPWLDFFISDYTAVRQENDLAWSACKSAAEEHSDDRATPLSDSLSGGEVTRVPTL